MQRLHLFEFEDLRWFPSFLRNAGTDYLQFLAATFDVHKPIIPILQRLVPFASQSQIIDLGSGGGGGYLKIVKHFKEENYHVGVMLTDIFPNKSAFSRAALQANGYINFYEEPVDAMNVPIHLAGLRTMFLSLHHFEPHQVKKILANAVMAKQPIAVFEGTERNFLSLVSMLFVPLMVLLFMPFIRPFHIGRILFTYLIPIIPFFILWDGIVSVLRTYTITELKSMAKEIDKEGLYEWEGGKKPNKPNGILYFYGYPKQS